MRGQPEERSGWDSRGVREVDGNGKSVSHHRSETLVSDDYPVNTNKQEYQFINHGFQVDGTKSGWH